MNKGTAMRKFVIALAVVAVSLTALPASAARCKHKADREARMPGEGIEIVEIYARAGDLSVIGRKDLTELHAEGELCTSAKAMLAESDVVIRRDGPRAQIIAEMPDTSEETDGPWSGEAAIMDLEIELPAGVAVTIYDSSGDMKVKGLAAAEITDSSGGIDVSDIAGTVVIPKDSSGDIEMERVGAVTSRLTARATSSSGKRQRSRSPTTRRGIFPSRTRYRSRSPTTRRARSSCGASAATC